MSLKHIPWTKEQTLENIIEYKTEELGHEIDRGNDLCKIIYSLMENDGPKALTEAQKERVLNIKNNIERMMT